MSILVIGSTGTIGTQVIEQIARRGHQVHALIHKSQARHNDNVVPVNGDTTDMESMRKAMSGIKTLFLLNPVVIDELNRALLMLDLAKEAGIQQVVYFSMFHADTFLDCPHACAKYATELMIRKFEIRPRSCALTTSSRTTASRSSRRMFIQCRSARSGPQWSMRAISPKSPRSS